MKTDIRQINEKDFLSFNDIPLIDCHTHILRFEKLTILEDVWRRYRVDRMNVLAASCVSEEFISDNSFCLLFKLRHPGRAYAFGSLHYLPDGAPAGGKDLLEQAKWLMSLGFDGMKMLDGKPDGRKRIGIPLDSPVYDLYFDYLEQESIPVLYHAADPAVFWDRDNVPAEAVKNNWAYMDDTFVSKAGIYREVGGILQKHPGLRVIFAHFYFMDEEGIDKASAFLERWPNVSFDLTPGMMYQTFAKDDGWKEFFTKYQDRLLFGTDNDYGESKELLYVLRTFLETGNEVDYWETTLRGMAMGRKALEKIYRSNFEKYAGNNPKAVNTSQLRAECERLSKRAEISPLKEKLLTDAGLVLGMLKDMDTK